MSLAKILIVGSLSPRQAELLAYLLERDSALAVVLEPCDIADAPALEALRPSNGPPGVRDRWGRIK